MSKTGKSIYCGAIALAFFASLRAYVAVSNMLFFGMMCIIFVLIAVSVYFIQGKMNENQAGGKEKLWSVLPVVTLGSWIVLFYLNETKANHSLLEEELVRRYIPFPLWITIIVVGTGICLAILNSKREGKNPGKCSKVIRAIISVVFTLVTSVQFYAPNILQDVQGGTFHSHAYTNSIMNICWLIPYSKDMQAMYGHYAIFYMPILKLMHSVWEIDYLTGLFIVSAVIAGISILLYLWIINYFAKNDITFYLGMLAIGEYYFMLMQGGVYLQVHPHRMIFPILLLAFALLEKRKGREYGIIAVGIIALAIVWSTEVGLVMMVAFSLYRWMQHSLDGEKFTLKKVSLLCKELVVYALIPFFLAYMIVNGYNLLVKGPWLDLREFLYPLISDRGYVSSVELPLKDITHAWIGASVLFLCPVCIAVISVLFPKKEKEREWNAFYSFIGIMSLGLMVYYINRPTEGSLFIVLFLMLVLQIIILQKSQEEYIKWKSDGERVFHKQNRFLFLALRVITTLILFVMAFDSVYSMPKAWKTSTETIWKRRELQEFADYIYVQVPPDAVAFGEGVPEILSMIDRDTHLHTTEWSYTNMPLDTMERIRYQLEGEKWIFCNLHSLWLMQEEYPGLTDAYELHEIFEYNGAQFGFFVINE